MTAALRQGLKHMTWQENIPLVLDRIPLLEPRGPLLSKRMPSCEEKGPLVFERMDVIVVVMVMCVPVKA